MMVRKKINPDELFVQLLIGDRYRPLRHVALFVVTLLLGLGNVYNAGNGSWLWIINVLILIPVPILLNVYVFVPRILLRNHPWRYMTVVVSVVLVCLFTGTIMLVLLNLPTPGTNGDETQNMLSFIMLNSLSTLLMFALILSGTTGMVIMQLWFRDRMRIAEMEEASNIAELEMLKNQINPHFLFNMLNNAIVLTKDSSSQAKKAILKLREMLNYQLKMSHMDRMQLKRDIVFLDDLLHLEKIRRDSFDFMIMVIGKLEEVEVPPLLFIPFVENAIKHGNDNTGESYILIIFKIESGKVDFFCTNSVPSHIQNAEIGGLGLKNIKRRLELIYGKDHRLDISSTDKTYNVNLTIGL